MTLGEGLHTRSSASSSNRSLRQTSGLNLSLETAGQRDLNSTGNLKHYSTDVA